MNPSYPGKTPCVRPPNRPHVNPIDNACQNGTANNANGVRHQTTRNHRHDRWQTVLRSMKRISGKRCPTRIRCRGHGTNRHDSRSSRSTGPINMNTADDDQHRSGIARHGANRIRTGNPARIRPQPRTAGTSAGTPRHLRREAYRRHARTASATRRQDAPRRATRGTCVR